MEYIKEGRGILFLYNSVRIGSYFKDGYFTMGRRLRLYSYANKYGLKYKNGISSHNADSEEYAWFIELHNSIAAGNHVIEGELLTKCLDLYYLLEYRYEKSLSNVYSRDIVRGRNISRNVQVILEEGNQVRTSLHTYKVTSDFMTKARESETCDVLDAILSEKFDIWSSAFPPRSKSARN
jgi:hypothetical protein